MNPFQRFKQILCINLDARQDRWKQMCEEIDREMRCCEVRRVPALRPVDAVENSPFVAFNSSQKKALELLESFPSMIIEDDCMFVNAYILTEAINELPADWEVLYGGANIVGIDTIPFRRPERYSPHLFKLFDAWQTHCMIYSKRGVERILDTFSVTCGYNFDEWLRQNIMPAGNCYIVAPQIAYQRASYSDIWSCNANFEHLFEAGNKLLV